MTVAKEGTISRSKLACRFHGRAWSKTCEECNWCLDAGAMKPPRPPVILEPDDLGGGGLAWIICAFLIAAIAVVAAVALVVFT